MSATDLEGRVEFLEWFEPGLRAGRYRVSAEQHLENAGVADAARPDYLNERFSLSADFVVRGRRFALDAAQIGGVFPPAGHAGEFERTLPHVVLNDPALPWTYSAYADEAEAEANRAPWLALLLFEESDPSPTPREGSVADLTDAAHGGRLPVGTRSYPTLHTLEFGESYADAVRYIDIPVDLFHEIAPAAVDLPYLAHGRRTELAKKPARPGDAAASTTDVSIVCANRLPRPGASHVACLVSLEGLAAYLPGEDGAPVAALAAAANIRLITLHSWTFSAEPLHESFVALLEAVTVAPYCLPRPANAVDLDARALEALDLGYCMLTHDLRSGERAPALYRGPFAPHAPSATPAPDRAYAAADSALRYDPDSGVLDISLAAAWQLGRLLALSSEAYSAELLAWQRAARRSAIAAVESERLTAILGPTLESGAAPVAVRSAPEAPATSARRLRSAPLRATAGGERAQPLVDFFLKSKLLRETIAEARKTTAPLEPPPAPRPPGVKPPPTSPRPNPFWQALRRFFRWWTQAVSFWEKLRRLFEKFINSIFGRGRRS